MTMTPINPYFTVLSISPQKHLCHVAPQYAGVLACIARICVWVCMGARMIALKLCDGLSLRVPAQFFGLCIDKFLYKYHGFIKFI
jgi:hypothetical protein